MVEEYVPLSRIYGIGPSMPLPVMEFASAQDILGALMV